MKDTGVLLIHGLMGSPREYTPLESVLRTEGYNTRTVTLPGHGPEPSKPFHMVDADHLTEHCLEAYEHFAKDVDQVVIIGHSLGGICTFLTAAQNPEKLKGVMVFSAPYEHAYWVNRTVDLVKLPFPSLVKGIVYAPECRNGFDRPDFQPWMFPKLIKESKQMFGALQEGLSQISVPVCLAHSCYDLVVPYTEMNKISAALTNAPTVTTHTLEESGHQIFPRSKDRDKATRFVLDFIQTSCAKPGARV